MPNVPPTFDEDDGIYVPAAAIVNVSGSAGATYTASEQGIINAQTAAINAMLIAMRTANIIAED